MSIQAYVGPTASSSHNAIVPVGAPHELSAEDYERRQKEVVATPNLQLNVRMVPVAPCALAAVCSTGHAAVLIVLLVETPAPMVPTSC